MQRRIEMTDDPRKKRSAAPAERSDAESENERPTVSPPFVMLVYAPVAALKV